MVIFTLSPNFFNSTPLSHPPKFVFIFKLILSSSCCLYSFSYVVGLPLRRNWTTTMPRLQRKLTVFFQYLLITNSSLASGTTWWLPGLSMLGYFYGLSFLRSSFYQHNYCKIICLNCQNLLKTPHAWVIHKTWKKSSL